MTTGSLSLTVKAVDTDEGPGEFEAVISTAMRDRDGETVKAGALVPLPASIPIYYNHDWRSGALPVAKAVPFYDGEVLKAKGTYASTERGQEMRSLVSEGIVDSMSVGFLKVQTKGKIVSKGELIEASFTGIPINTSAKVLASKALEDIDPMPGFNPAVKAVEGSYEARAERLQEALAQANPAAKWLWIRATFDDRVVYDTEGDTAESKTWQVTYTEGDDGFEFGTPTEVDLVEVVAPEDSTKSVETTSFGDNPKTYKPVNPSADDPAAASAAAGSSTEDAVNTLLARSLERVAAVI